MAWPKRKCVSYANISILHPHKPPFSCLRIFLYYWQVRKCEARRNARSPPRINFPFFMDGSQPIGATLHCSKIFPFFSSPPGFTCLEPITWKIRPFHWKAKPGPVDIFTMNWWPARWNTYLNCLGAVCEVSRSKCLHTGLHIPPPPKKNYLEIKVFIAANPQTTSSCAM